MFILRADRRFDIHVTYLLFPFFIVVVPQRIKLLKTVIALWYNKKMYSFWLREGFLYKYPWKESWRMGMLKFYISSFYFIFLLHLLFWNIDRFFFFFFILTREITETVDNRIRHGSIKSFFSHFWFFIS